MALIKLGALITEISGKIGGQSFGHGNGGTYLKNNGSQINRRTQTQLNQRSKTAYISSYWSQLSRTEKESFTTESVNYPYVNRVGQTKYYSGFNLFQKLNQGRSLLGLSLIRTCPAFSALSTPTVSIDTLTTSEINISASGVSASDTYLVFSAPMLSQGISNPFKYFKLLGVLSSAQLTAGFDVFDWYYSIFGQPFENSKIFVGLKPIKTVSGYGTTISTYNSSIVTTP